MKAWFVYSIDSTEEIGVTLAKSASMARLCAYHAARDAGWMATYIAFRAVRAPRYDNVAIEGRCILREYLNTTAPAPGQEGGE